MRSRIVRIGTLRIDFGLERIIPTDIYSSLDQTSSLEAFENKKPIEENKPTMIDC